MFSRNEPTLTGLQAATYDSFQASAAGIGTAPPSGGTALAVSGNVLITNGVLTAPAFAGACISDSLTLNSSSTACSSAALSNVAALVGGAIGAGGGLISGALTVVGQFNCSNIAVLGGFESVRAYETHSSNLVIDNKGTGPALRVTQVEGGPLGPQPVLEVYSGTGDAALVIDNLGNLAINRSTASYELDVSGGCRATAFYGSGAALTGLPSTGLPTTGGTISGSLGVGATPIFPLDCVGTVNARTNVQVGYTPFNGLWPSPSTNTYGPSPAVSANYGPYDATTAAQSYAASTFSGTSGTGSPWFGTSAINSTNYISTSTINEYVSYIVPSTMTMAYLNFVGGPTGAVIKIYGVNGGTSTLLCTENTVCSDYNTSCILPVNVTGYAQVKIVNIGRLYLGVMSGFFEGIQGVGWTVLPLAVWKASCALDVNGEALVRGNIGVGRPPSAYALDVSGGVNVSSLIIGSGAPMTVTNRQGGSSTVVSTPGTTNYAIGTNMIMQFGRVTLPTSTAGATVSTLVTFPVAFTNVPIIMVACQDFAYSGSTTCATGSSGSVTSCYVYATCPSATTPVINWFAIGN